MSIADRNRLAALERATAGLPDMREHIGSLTSTLGAQGKRIKKALREMEATAAKLEQIQLDLDKLRVEVGDE